MFGVVFGLLFVSLIGVVSGATCSDDENIIMRLYQPTNSHGALWDGSDLYTTEICYDGTAPANPHPECTEDNSFLWLSADYNSHASTYETAEYNVGVCYKGLECVPTNEASCDGEILLSLYQDTNSHIGEGNVADYPIKICCTSTLLTGSFWQKMNGVPTGVADLNDWVQLNASGIGLTGRNITYDITKVNGGWLWFDKKVATISSAVITTWQANDSGTFFFEASLEGDDANETSNELIVSNTEQNSDPVAVITGPEDRQMYFINTELTFTQDSYDEDDEFDYTWDLGDETELSGNSVNKENWGFTHTYTTAGQKDIVLSVEDGREGYGRDQISILILDSAVENTQVLSYIKNPQWGEGYGRTIEFDGTGSYVAKYNMVDVDCLAGYCPLTTKNIPSGVGSLDVNNPNQGYTNMNFNWLFTNGLSGATATENAENNPMINRSFDTPSMPGNPHKAALTVTYSAP